MIHHRSLFAEWVALLLFAGMFLASIGRPARAEDSHGVVGAKMGCKDFTAKGSFVTFAPSDLEDVAGSGALSGTLYVSTVQILNTSASVYLCLAASASCGADTTNKPVTAAGAARLDVTYGMGVTSIALRAANAVTGQVCVVYRTTP